ncbi:AraC family transcriptional regulator [Crateriforma spongiae]|uniref:AraC family transcriptional regulator n=1 Tax=Crateriforma spongiae TaxID=2724528 RepID=UPI0014478910|nr:DNA-binding transcriptional regulator [Crateriforma spongiae]
MAQQKHVLLLVETSRVFGRGVIEGISRFAKEQADWIFHFQDRGILEGLSPWLRNWKGDGIITRSAVRSLAKEFDRLKCPVVELLGDGQTLISEVRTDEMITAEHAIDHLIKQGYPHVAFYSHSNSWWSDARLKAFETIVRQRGLSGHVYPGAFKGDRQPYPPWKPAYEKPTLQWLDQLPKPVGIWAVADSQAVRLLESCWQIDLRVPVDVGILGTSNDELVCRLLSPSLSSIDLDASQIGYHAAALLDQKMNRPTPKRSGSKKHPKPRFIPPGGVVSRGSTNPIAIHDPELAMAMQIIARDAMHGLTVEQLAQEMYVSRSTLERRFRAYFKHSPAHEINQTRVERAKTLLRDTALPVHAVSDKVGFASPENFVRFFRRIVGKTPRQYRLQFFHNITRDVATD